MLKIEEIIQKLRDGNLDNPAELANFLVMLSASLLSASNFETEAKIVYSGKWLELKSVLKTDGKEKSDKMIDMEATQTEEYRNWQKMRNANESIKEAIMALKKKLSVNIY